MSIAPRFNPPGRVHGENTKNTVHTWHLQLTMVLPLAVDRWVALSLVGFAFLAFWFVWIPLIAWVLGYPEAWFILGIIHTCAYLMWSVK